jgi:membrane-bound serine protease (ClpP class)
MGGFMKKCIRLLVLWVLTAACFLYPALSVRAAAQETEPVVVVLTARGSLSPVMLDYLERGLSVAQEHNARLVVLQLDTPGGSIDLMNRMVETIRASSIPVAVYVAPRGAMAGSAGTLITLAGHISAMAPETAIGAASPVDSTGQDIGETMDRKVKEILKATARSLTTDRPADATKLAEEMIENARAVSVDEATQVGLIDLKADSLDDLIQKIDGRSIKINDQVLVLKTRGAETLPVPLTLVEQVLLLLVNPNLVFLLLTLGVNAILLEFSSPGGWVAGTTGVICLILAIYAMGLLPVNWFGMLFLLLAFILFILDIKAPTHGALTAAGAASFIAGGLVLFNSTPVPGVPGVSVPLVVGTGIFMALGFFAIVTIALRAQRVPVRTGQTVLVGLVGETRGEINPHGQVQVQVAGELWSAELAPDEEPMPSGTPVIVTGHKGLRLVIKRKDA